MPSLDPTPTTQSSLGQRFMYQNKNRQNDNNGTAQQRLINFNGVDNRLNQFQYTQFSHGPVTQLYSQWNGNPPPGHHVSSNGGTQSHKRNGHYSRYSKIQQPYLISLDRTDFNVTLFQYPLLTGVTMLGSGKGTVKPPDIVLHGLQIAPQHAFLERLGDEVILHPISENTKVDGRSIVKPTSLQPGNLISIGDSYFFRYQGPPPTSPSPYTGPHNHIFYEESPYAIINPNSTTRTMREDKHSKNRCPLSTQDPTASPSSSCASSFTLESESQICRMDQSLTSFPSPRSSSTSTSDPDQTSSSVCTEDGSCSSRRYRDTLESEDFLNKVAKFEMASHTHPEETLIRPPSRTAPWSSSNNGNGCSMFLNNENNNNPEPLYSEISKGKKVLSKPNPSFNRSGQGFGMNTYNSHDDSSFSSSSISPPDRNQSSSSNKSYSRRPGVSFYENGCIISPTSTTEDQEEVDSVLVTSSVPSPDSSSLTSSSVQRSPTTPNTNNSHQTDQTRNHDPSISPNYRLNLSYNNNHRHAQRWGNINEAEIACETLLQIKRKQAEEARLAEEMSRKKDHLELDEILAMCEEYEEQIAKEIEEKRKNSCSTLSSPSPSLSMNSKSTDSNDSSACGANYNGTQKFNLKSGQDTDVHNEGETLKSPTSPSNYNYGRIKTNGSLPRDSSRTKTSITNGNRCVDEDAECSSIFTYSMSDKKKPSSSSLLNEVNGYCQNAISDKVLLSPNTTTSILCPGRNGSSPYENVTNDTSHCHVQSPPRLGLRATSERLTSDHVYSNTSNCSSWRQNCNPGTELSSQPIYSSNSCSTFKPNFNNRNHQVSNSHVPHKTALTTHKSKLSVSFANSVKEFGADEEIGEDKCKSLESDEFQRETGNGKSVVKQIAAEVEVHVAENRDDDTIPEYVNRIDLSTNIGTSNTNQHPQAPMICVTKCASDVESLDPQSIKSPLFSANDSGKCSSQSQSLSQREKSETKSVEESKSDQQPVLVLHEESHSSNSNEDPITLLKKEIREVEEQEMETIREMEIEKALLVGEEKSLENQLALDNEELTELKDRLAQIDESNRRWKTDGLERIAELKAKLMCSEKELQRLERMHEEFCGSTDEETVLLERLKFQHELVESDRKAFEDSEFYHMEEEINRETQKDELCKLISDKGRRVLTRQVQLEKVRSQKRISFGSCSKEIQNLEKKRQELLNELRKMKEGETGSQTSGQLLLQVPCSPEVSTCISDCEELNSELEEKLRNLRLSSSSTDDELHIERIKSRSPIDPNMGTLGPKTCETLREIERNREYLLDEQGVRMLEQERARVRELQKRIQDAVREEWEASRKARTNQCHSLNSVGSEDSGNSTSDSPTDSGSGDDTTDKSIAPSISTTDIIVVDNNQDEQQMRQKRKEMSQNYEETRPLSSEASEIGFDENGTQTVLRRDKPKGQTQNRPLTRYLPVREEDDFDLRAHIESSGHQLGLCPHIIVNQSSARGFLSKLGGRFHNWNKRWFVFDREKRTFMYFSDKSEKKSKARGGVHFEAIEEVYVDHLQSVKSPAPTLTFCVKTHNRIFYLLAPTAEAMRMWIDIIFTGAEGYKEFKCGP